MTSPFPSVRRLAVLFTLGCLALPVTAWGEAPASGDAPLPHTAGTQPPLLAILSDTGQVRGGLPVFRPHPDASRIAGELERGFPARMARLYRLVQVYLHGTAGTEVEPAYLEFSGRQGGFPGFGFWLGATAKPRAGYVDLYDQRQRRPRFGGMDQIFPHELAHVIMRQLIGEPPPGGSTQGHAVGVRTDPIVAFDEGFAEHCQVMALDDPDADPRSSALLADAYWKNRAAAEAAAYRRALEARWAPAVRSRVTFMFWYSGAEQVMRYYGVKANAFARRVPVPERLLATGDPYAAYLLENTLPGGPRDEPKTAAQMLATEGVVSTLYWRWATSEALRQAYRPDDFYAAFGVRRSEVPPDLNVYLKLFYVFHASKPHTAQQAITAYTAVFPDEAAAVHALVREVLLGQPLPAGGEVWLANDTFRVGTRVFDQFRAMPRTHTFDLNAASVADLVAVPGVSLDLARRIARGGPYANERDLARVPGMSADVLARFGKMAQAARSPQSSSDAGGSLLDLVWACGRRAVIAWLAAAALAALGFRRIRQCGWMGAVLAGLAASFVTLAVGWAGGATLATGAAAPLVFGVPAVLLSLRRRPRAATPGRIALAWLVAVLPALILVTPLF